MEVTVRGKQFDVPPKLEERARTKLGQLDHFLPLLRDAVVEVNMTHEKAKQPDQRYLVHVRISGNGVHLETEERAAQPEAAVDQAAHVLSRQARRHKGRLYDRGRNKTAKEVAAEPGPPPDPEEEVARAHERLSRVKRILVKPMTVGEAVEQMEALGHDFFVFHEEDREQFVVLYRRHAGDYGLIVPELS